MPEQSKPDEKPEGLALEYTPNGRSGKATLTAKLAGKVVAVESLDLTKPKARADFAKRLCDGRAGIDPAAVEAELLQAAADLASRPAADAPTDWGNMPELDVSRIVRPERFITPEVSGLAVPMMTTLGEKVVGRWQVYLRWQDGKRERRSLGPTIDLPGGGRLWVHPEPTEPNPTMRPAWSAEARKRWLAGEPAPDPAEVFKAVCERVAYFLDLPRPEAPGVTATLACWAIHTYCYQAWHAVPHLYVGGPLGSGKSRAFEILGRLVFRPFVTSSLTAPALFRTLHAAGGVLLLDEAERLRDTRDPGIGEILSMLLAGYKRGATATRLEPVGDTFKTVAFQVFGPKALACVAGLPPALASRCIPVTMFRAAPGSPKPKRRIDADPSGWQRLRDELHALALEHGPDFLGMPDRTDVCPPGIDGRDYELWQPLLALASWIEAAGARGLLGLLQEHALRTIDAGRDDQTPDHDQTLLRLLAEAVQSGERPEPGELLRKAQEDEPAAFKNWTARAVTAHLKRYDIPTPRKSMGRRVFRDVTTDHLRRIQDSYGIDLDVPGAATVPHKKEAPQ